MKTSDDGGACGISVNDTTFKGWPALELRNHDSQALVLKHGAQVVSWIAQGREQLYLSPTAEFIEGKAVRGGIPICFPQFDLLGPLPKHGFARVLPWAVQPETPDGASAAVALVQADSEATRASWPHAFKLSLTIRLGRDDLDLNLTVANVDAKPFEFTGALHTYLRIVDAKTAQLCGLGGCEYRDNKTGLQGVDASNACLPMESVGRTYRGPSSPLELRDGANALAIESRAFEDVVVWNPGFDPQFHDLPPDAWRDFLCVEAAQVNRPVTLNSGEQWSGAQRLRAKVSRDVT